MSHYLPEGRLIRSEDNCKRAASIDALAEAMQNREIIEANAYRCDASTNLYVRLGSFRGIIPREEAALGLSEGKVKEIAVLSRVGKSVAFRIVGLQANDGLLSPVLSRKAAQKDVRAHITALPPGSVLPATVCHMERFGAFVDVGCGLISMIPIDRISTSRITHPEARFYPGQEIFAVYRGYDEETGHILLSHRELLGTWEENANQFRQGDTVTGIVRGVKSYGIFVELAPNLTGLAEYREGVEENQTVSVYIKSILPQRRKIKLLVISPLDIPAGVTPIQYHITQGNVSGWDYFSVLT